MSWRKRRALDSVWRGGGRFGFYILLVCLALEVGGKTPQLLGNEGVGCAFRRPTAVLRLIQEILLCGHVVVLAVGILNRPYNAELLRRFRMLILIKAAAGGAAEIAAEDDDPMSSVSGKIDPVVRPIGAADLIDAFGKGLRDFQAMPLYGLTLGALFAGGGILIVLCATAFGMSYLSYPLAAGFALIGPFAAVFCYELSRRREAKEPISVRGVIAKVCSRGEIGWMAFVTLFIFIMWMYQVRLLMALLLGLNVSFSSFHEFISVVLTTNEGLVFLAVGNLDGALLSLVLFSLTVVSFPLLLDRECDFITAMITSVRAVVTSPLPMIGWAAAIVAVLIVSAMPAFLGLIVTLPILGHTTWHLYRRIVAPVDTPG